jgi:hypothetical protein
MSRAIFYFIRHIEQIRQFISLPGVILHLLRRGSQPEIASWAGDGYIQPCPFGESQVSPGQGMSQPAIGAVRRGGSATTPVRKLSQLYPQA